jgi:hypothetical protein
MGRALATAAHGSSGFLPRIGTAFLKFWFEAAAIMFGGYRPEKHYMRGPGPAWRKKHGG